MRTIHKYQLQIEQHQEIQLHEGAEILCLQVQNNDPFLWMMVDTQRPMVSMRIITHGTGHEVHPDAGRYLGTYQLNDGQFVFHCFEPKVKP